MLLRICLLLVLPLCAQAGEPLSRSMAQCSALYDVVEMSLMSRPDRERARYAANVWAAYAAHEARREGRKVASVDHARFAQRRDWGSSKWFANSQEFRDWLAYCKALARDREIPFDPYANS